MNVMDKSIHQIDCDDVSRKLQSENEMHLYSDRSHVLNDTHYTNETSILLEGQNRTILFNVTNLEIDVCRAEIESQALDNKLSAFSTFLNWFPSTLITIFAARWSDKQGKRKSCMIFSMIGEIGCFIGAANMQVLLFIAANFFFVPVFLIAVVFFEQLPLEFSAVLTQLVPALFGGTNLMLMGAYSYLSDTTPKEDRTCRFNLLPQLIALVSVVFLPMADSLFSSLGYFSNTATSDIARNSYTIFLSFFQNYFFCAFQSTLQVFCMVFLF